MNEDHIIIIGILENSSKFPNANYDVLFLVKTCEKDKGSTYSILSTKSRSLIKGLSKSFISYMETLLLPSTVLINFIKVYDLFLSH